MHVWEVSWESGDLSTSKIAGHHISMTIRQREEQLKVFLQHSRLPKSTVATSSCELFWEDMVRNGRSEQWSYTLWTRHHYNGIRLNTKDEFTASYQLRLFMNSHTKWERLSSSRLILNNECLLTVSWSEEDEVNWDVEWRGEERRVGVKWIELKRLSDEESWSEEVRWSEGERWSEVKRREEMEWWRWIKEVLSEL